MSICNVSYRGYCSLGTGARHHRPPQSSDAHSWRHGVKQFFKNHKEVKEELHDAISGHSNPSVGHKYGDYSVAAKAEAIALLPNPLSAS
jgi:hypothetical protein